MTDYPSVDALVERLDLEPHPEGGFYRETWRSELSLPSKALPDHDGSRNAGTSILYLIPEGDGSTRHRVVSDELWLFQYGDPVELTVEPNSDDSGEVVTLGTEPDHQFQALIPGHHWQSARSTGKSAGYSIVACVVVPGFEFEDLEFD